MDLCLCEDDTGPGGVLDREPGSTCVTGYTTDGSGEMVAVEGLDVLDLKGVDVEVVHTEQSDSVLEESPGHERERVSDEFKLGCLDLRREAGDPCSS